MKKVPPPANYAAYSPSELFRFFFQIGHWTEESFISDFQSYTRGKLISTVTVNKWKNRDVIPTRYSGQLFKLIKDQFEDKVSDNWILAFETVWATHQARSHEAAPKLTQDKLSSQICAQHINWIQAEYNHAHQGETFSTAEIYVPIQLIDQLIDKTLEAPTLYEVEDLVTAFSENPNALTAHDWIFISGGSGSGKSMASLHLGHKLSNTDVFPIYLRGRHWSDIEMDFRDSHHPISDAFSNTSYLKYFRSSSHQRACLIIDGIDEISAVGSKDSRSLNSIFAALISEQNICRSHGKALHIVMTGRRAHVEFGTKLISPEQLQHLELLGLDGSYRHQGDLSSETLGHDLRQLWWEKYLAANAEKPDPSLPDFLSVEYSDFSDLSSSPLLTYLLCWIALNSEDTCNTNNTFAYERVNNLTQSNHTNDVYLKLIESIWSRGELQKRYNIDADSFLSVLQHIALATWHAPESQSISLEAVPYCQLPSRHIHPKHLLPIFIRMSPMAPRPLIKPR